MYGVEARGRRSAPWKSYARKSLAYTGAGEYSLISPSRGVLHRQQPPDRDLHTRLSGWRRGKLVWVRGVCFREVGSRSEFCERHTSSFARPGIVPFLSLATPSGPFPATPTKIPSSLNGRGRKHELYLDIYKLHLNHTCGRETRSNDLAPSHRVSGLRRPPFNPKTFDLEMCPRKY